MKKLKNLSQSNNAFRVIALLVLLISLAVTLIPKYKSEYNKNETNFTLEVLEYKIDGNVLSMTLKGKEKLKANYYIKTENEKKNLEEKLELYDTLELKGELIKPTNNTVPNLFNYKKYLYYNKIYYILNIETLKIKSKTTNLFYKLKKAAYNHANNIKNNKYIYAYILGTTEMLDEKVLESYRTNGISHLFALSGLHVGIFNLILMKVLKKLKLKEIYNYIIVFSILLIFTFITGFSASLLRSILLFILLGLNKIYKLNIRTINIFYLTFSIIVITNPFIIYQVGFILSFTTTFFLILTNNLLENKNYIQSLLLVSIISFLSSLGVSIYFFNVINPVGILLNLLFVPLVSFIIFPLALIVYILPFLTPILSFLTSIMESLSLAFTKIKLQINFPTINVLAVFIYYFFLILLFQTKKKKLIFPIIFILLIWKYYPYLDNSTRVYFIDVGQGDSSLIINPHLNKTILIDTGGKISYNKEKWKQKRKENSISKDTLIPFMQSIGINSLDYLILTHGDVDHMGESLNLINNFKVKNVIINCGDANNLETNLINELRRKNIPYYNCLEEVKNIELNLLFLNTSVYDNENDNSIVVYTELDKFNFLFMGDASTKVEENLLNKYNFNQIDVLKVGHHGSKTSTSKNFINVINPKYSIISVGKNNRYNHPNKEVLTTLEKSKIYRTDKFGSIMFKIKNRKLYIKTYTP